jgi:hypothetical protein
MGNGGGRTWDSVTIIDLDGNRIHGYMEYTWGKNFYFEIDGRWYAGSNLAFKEVGPYRYDLRQPETFSF